MPESEDVQIPIRIPAFDLDQQIKNAVVESKLGKIIEDAIKDTIGNQYKIGEQVKTIVMTEVRSVVTDMLTLPYLDDTKNPGYGDENHPARRLRAAIVAEVEKQLSDADTLRKIVGRAIGGGY